MQILLVEDNPVDQMFVTQSLQQVEGFDYQLTCTGSLSEALKKLVASAFDVVLLDLWLPDSEGLETCHRVVSANRDIPVVVMTGIDDRTLAKEAIRGGAQDYLVKGAYPGSAVARVLQYAIDRHQFQREVVERQNHFNQVLSHVPAIIWTTDPELKINSVAGAEVQILGRDPQHVVGLTLEECFHITDESDEVIKAHQRALEGKSTAIETLWRGRNFEARVNPRFDPKSTVVGTIGVAMDVTDRRLIDREIGFARLVQKALLPAEHPQLKGFEVFGGSHPARKTCGDWFDYLVFPDGSLGMAVGDVSGKGFGPAILSATIAAYLEVLAETHSDVQDMLHCCNQLVCKRNLNGQFAVLSLARLQAGTRSVIYGGAGEHMLIVDRNGRLKHEAASSGVPFGMFADFIYEPSSQVLLESGDILLILTDGFREARNPQGVNFGEHRIVETVAANLQASAKEIFNALRQAARSYAEDRHSQDDMTGIVVKVLDD